MRFLFEDYALDTDRRELRHGGKLVRLAPQVFDLLDFLVRNRERVVSKDDLIAAVWDGRIVSEAALTTRINAVRSAIGDSGEQQRLIKTVPRKGMRFVGGVREEPEPEGGPAAGTSVERRGHALALPDKPSIAVLPFTNMSGDPEQGYFADGMAEDIITALSRCNWLFVIARNSSFTYKGRAVDVREVGRELGVRYVLEGSVRRAANRVRFTSQLVDASSGAHIWADRFEGEMSNVFDLQDRITESVVGAIEPKLQLAEIERIKQKPAASLDAYDLLLRAQQLEYEFTETSLVAALGYLKQALNIDPSYAPALSLAAYCYVERRSQGWAENVEAEGAEGLRYAARAVELARDDSNVLWKAAYAGRSFGMDPKRAQELLNRSLQLNPNSAMALTIAAWGETILGDSVEALRLVRRAERLSPRDPRAWFMAAAEAQAHYMSDEFDQAVSCAKRALAQNPRYARTLRVLAASLAKLGRRAEAAEAIQEILAIEPQVTISRLRTRIGHWPELTWKKFADGLTLAGLPA